jgi:asparagine synthase (glutamine-hydrolysing)
MLVSRTGTHIERFWNWIPQVRKKWHEPELIEEYQELLQDAVRLQLRSDVPVGLFLSSGIDSAVLLAIMRGLTSRPVQAFTIGFEGGEKTNEVEDAKELARMFGADHYFQMLGPEDYVKYYERYLWDLEEPVGNETAAAFYFVARLARQEVKVALTGQGADEPWAGYDRYKGIKLSKYYAKMPGVLKNGLAPLIANVPGRMERFKRGVDSLGEPDVLTRFTKVYSFFNADMKAQLYTGALKDGFSADPYGTRRALSRLQSDVRHLDPLTQMLYIDARANLPDDLLMVADKTSMAVSLESRVPFLDYRLVQFIESLPPSLKLNGMNGKYLHKKAVEKWLPKKIVYRKKKGFANPVEDWFRSRMKSFVEDCLLGSSSFMSRYFDQNVIRRLLEADRAGTGQYRRHLYLLVSLELWHRTFLGKPAPVPAVNRS